MAELPPCAAAAQPAPTKREVERALLACGLSPRQAKRLVAGGWPAAFKASSEADELVDLVQESIERLRAR